MGGGGGGGWDGPRVPTHLGSKAGGTKRVQGEYLYPEGSK